MTATAGVGHEFLRVDELFEKQAASKPYDVAIIFDDQEVTYGQLNGRSNQVAHGLRACGVGRDVIIGVQMTRSVDMVVALLGVLKAGGAYLPMDPS